MARTMSGCQASPPHGAAYRAPSLAAMAASGKGSDVVDTKIVEPLVKFFKEAYGFVDKCQKPNFAEMRQISTVVAVGFGIMGVIGFFVKLFAMPLNQVLMS
ncbi:hypothetical protein FNF31_05639 [Cafeteria roenbergensis]|uniref:Protein transport protein Sec61 subunit gamma n=3 Tax=Cafeteria roenbergensis TaxID=33653 RepID=A0A5A8D1S4_CAFRO|nr:hypothetical protein FNF31_05639 [Cafeteria roenbergensis]